MPTVGFISQLWPPAYGGGERHLHDMAADLAERGCDVKVFCGTAAEPGGDNGVITATRWGDPRAAYGSTWSRAITGRGRAAGVARAAVMADYAFMDAAVRWARENGIQIAILGSPFQTPDMFHTRELHLQLKASGVRVGLMAYDLGWPVSKALANAYRTQGCQWEAAAAMIAAEIRLRLGRQDRRDVHFTLRGPLFFDPDFLITPSDWNRRLFDPFGRTPTFVSHPPVASTYWSGRDPLAAAMPRREVLMVNPQARKGAQHMAALIGAADPAWTFRVVRGGWGNAFEKFMPQVAPLAAVREGRVEFVEFVPDMREAYRAAGVVFFPSLIEGYGMTAVEPMFCGTPVVCSNYPAIIEGVGEAALTLCPHTSAPEAWRDAVRQVLADPGPWRARSLARAAEIERRRIAEAGELAAFLQHMV